MALTLDERQEYVDIIKALYGSSMYVDESQITDEVADIVETILLEIRSGTMYMGIFATVVNAVVGGMVAVLESLGFGTAPSRVAFVEEALKDPLKDWVKKKVQTFGKGFAKSMFKQWKDILMGNLQSKAVVNSAALNWKSALAIALLGI